MFDIQFNMWSGAAVLWLQRSLNGLNRGQKDYANVRIDGLMGVDTLVALRSYMQKRAGDGGEMVLLRLVLSQRVCDYLRQATTRKGAETSIFGWVSKRGGLPA
jgi:lysozyme family protein